MKSFRQRFPKEYDIRLDDSFRRSAVSTHWNALYGDIFANCAIGIFTLARQARGCGERAVTQHGTLIRYTGCMLQHIDVLNTDKNERVSA